MRQLLADRYFILRETAIIMGMKCRLVEVFLSRITTFSRSVLFQSRPYIEEVGITSREGGL